MPGEEPRIDQEGARQLIVRWELKADSNHLESFLKMIAPYLWVGAPIYVSDHVVGMRSQVIGD